MCVGASAYLSCHNNSERIRGPSFFRGFATRNYASRFKRNKFLLDNLRSHMNLTLTHSQWTQCMTPKGTPRSGFQVCSNSYRLSPKRHSETGENNPISHRGLFVHPFPRCTMSRKERKFARQVIDPRGGRKFWRSLLKRCTQPTRNGRRTLVSGVWVPFYPDVTL